MLNGFHHRGEVDLPNWAHPLYAPYYRIRVEGRNKALRRKHYRIVEKLKLQLVENGYDLELVEAICRYLVNHRKTSAAAVQKLLDNPNPQLRLF
jgi:hypothetical protein